MGLISCPSLGTTLMYFVLPDSESISRRGNDEDLKGMERNCLSPSASSPRCEGLHSEPPVRWSAVPRTITGLGARPLLGTQGATRPPQAADPAALGRAALSGPQGAPPNVI